MFSIAAATSLLVTTPSTKDKEKKLDTKSNTSIICMKNNLLEDSEISLSS